MRPKKNSSEPLERVMDQLCATLLGLSDEDILAEVRAAGRDAQREAERVRRVLERPLQVLENVNVCLANLGHAVNPSQWYCGPLAYHNTCVRCGLSVSLTIASAEIQGSAVRRACRASGTTIPQTGTFS
jgi:hypothetical protein